jgi:tripartite-type tricarboxylate transporter receptor subunit TctC
MTGMLLPRVLLAVALAATTDFAAAQPAPAPFPAGRPVAMHVGTTPGGGNDNVMRMVARHIGKYLPGKPTVIVKNMPGAGGITLSRHLSMLAAKDGTEIAMLQDANLFQQLTTTQQIPYDARSFGYLGALEKFVPMVLAWHTTRFHSFDDTRKDSMSVGSDGPGSSTDYFPRVLNAFFGTKFKVVRGYKGSADITLAIERGEIDGLSSWCYDCMKAQKPQWIAENRVRVLLQLALEGDPDLDAQGVPKVIDLAKSDEERQAVQLAFSGVSIARPMVAPPGLAPAQLATLRAALAETVKDPELLEEARKGRNNIRFTPAERMEKVVAQVYATNPALVEKVRNLMSQ